MCLIVGCGNASNTSNVSTVNPDPVESMENTENTESTESTQLAVSDEKSTTDENEPEIGILPETKQVEEQEYIEVIGNNVRIRSSVSTETNDNILGKAKKGDKFVKTGEDGEWSELDYDGQNGYIKSEFIKNISEEEFKATAEPVEQAETEIPQVPVEQDNNDVLLAQQQQEALLAQQQQEALLAQQQQEALLAQQLQQQQADAAANGGGSGTWENAQMRSDRIVYITPTGKKYHYDQQCAGKNAIPINLDEAMRAHDPCGTCVLK